MASSSYAPISQLELDVNSVPQSRKAFAAPDDVEILGVKEIKKGAVVMLREGNLPCKITDLTKSKTGKHGTKKYHVFGKHVLTGKTYDDIFYTGESVIYPREKKENYRVLCCDEWGKLTLQHMQQSSKTRDDIVVDVEQGIGETIYEQYLEGEPIGVCVYKILGFEVVVSCFEDKSNPEE